MSEQTHNMSDAKKQILSILKSWGKNAIGRYLRDNDLTEVLVESLPLKDYEATGEDRIQEALIDLWDDYSDQKLEELQLWNTVSKQSGLLRRLTAFSDQLLTQGFAPQAQEVMGMASQVANASERQMRAVTASDLIVGDLLHLVGGKTGFGSSNMPGKVTRITKSGSSLLLEVKTSKLGDAYKIFVSAGESVGVLKTVRPRQAASMLLNARKKLFEAESLLTGKQAEALKPRFARAHFLLQKQIDAVL